MSTFDDLFGDIFEVAPCCTSDTVASTQEIAAEDSDLGAAECFLEAWDAFRLRTVSTEFSNSSSAVSINGTFIDVARVSGDDMQLTERAISLEMCPTAALSCDCYPEFDIDGLIVTGTSLQFLTTGIVLEPKSLPKPFRNNSYFACPADGAKTQVTFSNSSCVYIGTTDNHAANVYILLYDMTSDLLPCRPKFVDQLCRRVSEIAIDSSSFANPSLSTSSVLSFVPDNWKQDLGAQYLGLFSMEVGRRVKRDGIASGCLFLVRKFGQKHLSTLTNSVEEFLLPICNPHHDSVRACFMDVGVTWNAGESHVLVWKRSFIETLKQSDLCSVESFMTGLCPHYGDCDMKTRVMPNDVVHQKLYAEEIHTRRFVGQLPFQAAHAFSLMVHEFSYAQKMIHESASSRMAGDRSEHAHDARWFENSMQELRGSTGRARWEITFDMKSSARVDDVLQAVRTHCVLRRTADESAHPFFVFESNDWSDYLLRAYHVIMSRIHMASEVIRSHGTFNATCMMIYYTDLMKFFITGSRKDLSCWKLWDVMHSDRLLQQGIVFLPSLSDFVDAVDEAAVASFFSRAVPFHKDVWDIMTLGSMMQSGVPHGQIPFRALQFFATQVVKWIARDTNDDGAPLPTVRQLRQEGRNVDCPQRQATWHDVVIFLLQRIVRLETIPRDSPVLLHAVGLAADMLSLSLQDAVELVARSLDTNVESLPIYDISIIPFFQPMPLCNVSKAHSDRSAHADVVQVLRRRLPPQHFAPSVDQNLNGKPSAVRAIVLHVWECETGRRQYDASLVSAQLKHTTISDVLSTSFVCRSLDGIFQLRQPRDCIAYDHARLQTTTTTRVSQEMSVNVNRAITEHHSTSTNVVAELQRPVVTVYTTPQKRVAWTQDETVALIQGVEQCGTGAWKDIATCMQFDGKRFNRRPEQLKDRWRTMTKNVAMGRRIGMSDTVIAMFKKAEKRERVLEKDDSDSCSDETSRSGRPSTSPNKSVPSGGRQNLRSRTLFRNPSPKRTRHDAQETEPSLYQSDNDTDSSAFSIRSSVSSALSADCPAGLSNSSTWSICWLNALVQSLASVECLNEWCQSYMHLDEFGSSVRYAICRIVHSLKTDTEKCTSVKMLAEAMSDSGTCESFADRRQHDPLEFFVKCVSEMELETFFSCQMQCKQACKGGVIVHEFQDISDPCVVINVPVPKSTVTLHLQRLVDDLFEPEIVSMQESAAGACEGCGALERVRLSVVTHTSVGLCINLQIVQYDDDASPARTRQRTKNKVPIACPSTIELNDQVYVVRSLILHDNQHYRCIRKHRDSWFLCDDSEVTAISDSQALKPRHDISCVFAELYQ